MQILALDIETDTSPLTDDERAAGFQERGLHPGCTAITAVALSGSGLESVLLGSEEAILRDLFDVVESTAAHWVTWNGSVFDWPFIIARAVMSGIRVPFGWEPDPTVPVKYEPTPGFTGGIRLFLPKGSEHSDLMIPGRDDASRLGVPWSLKPYAGRVSGLTQSRWTGQGCTT